MATGPPPFPLPCLPSTYRRRTGGIPKYISQTWTHVHKDTRVGTRSGWLLIAFEGVTLKLKLNRLPDDLFIPLRAPFHEYDLSFRCLKMCLNEELIIESQSLFLRLPAVFFYHTSAPLCLLLAVHRSHRAALPPSGGVLTPLRPPPRRLPC